MYGRYSGFCDDLFSNFFYPYGGFVMMFFGLLLVGAIIWFLVKGGNNVSLQKFAGKDTPLEILQKRFINGEISREEFEEKKNILK